MEIILTVIAAVILIVSIAQTRMTNVAPKTEESPSIENNISSPSPSESPKASPTIHPTSTPTPKPQTSQNQSMDEYIYPASKVISSSVRSLSLTSNDDPGKITSWYKEKIQSKNLNVNSFVNTQANDKILNKLVGDNGQISISVEVSKENANAQVNITIGTTSK